MNSSSKQHEDSSNTIIVGLLLIYTSENHLHKKLCFNVAKAKLVLPEILLKVYIFPNLWCATKNQNQLTI
jgi:hypothetical protein